MFKRLREKLEAALAAATPPPDLRDIAVAMRSAVIEQKAAVRALREAAEDTEEALSRERAQLATAERRRALAADIQDGETVQVAERFAAKHRERAAVLERKAAAQREELALAEQDLTEMMAQLRSASQRVPDLPSERGMVDPGEDLDEGHLRSQLDREAREATAAAKLEELKRRMGRS